MDNTMQTVQFLKAKTGKSGKKYYTIADVTPTADGKGAFKWNSTLVAFVTAKGDIVIKKSK
jgi:hypothetical protein